MRVLVVEDNQVLAGGLSVVLRNDGYVVDVVADGLSADAAIAAQDYDLVILDLTLPGMDGLEVLRSMRGRRSEATVLVLTARASVEDRVTGLDLGADDYLAKPFEIGELEARVRALLRRRLGLRTSTVACGPLTLDLKARSLTAEGRPLELPARELSVLETMMLAAGRVVSKQQIVESLSAFDEVISDNAIEQYVSRLRKRLAPIGLRIRTARGLGYYLEEADVA
jgi:two-component system, OmpR family, response regulator TctD